jgi:hypothetical protein
MLVSSWERCGPVLYRPLEDHGRYPVREPEVPVAWGVGLATGVSAVAVALGKESVGVAAVATGVVAVPVGSLVGLADGSGAGVPLGWLAAFPGNVRAKSSARLL